MSDIKLTIDGKEVTAQQGDTVLKAAQKADIHIPTLCAHDALEPYGACRLCIVQIEGVRGNPTSCTTPAADGMVVTTNNDEIFDTRREIVKLLMSGHTSPCLVCFHRDLCEKYRPQPFKTGKATRCTFCNKRDSCELRVLAAEMKIDEMELPIIYKNMDVEHDDPFMDRDYNQCVLCGRCARICKKIHGKGAIDFIDRGKNARIGTAFHHLHADDSSDCKFCGACVDICPVGAMSDRFAKWRGAPDQKVESACTLCPLGCSLMLNLNEGELTSCSMTAPAPEARICAVGRFVLPQLMDNPRRMKRHRIMIPDGLICTEYEEAVEIAAEKFSGAKGNFALIAHEAATREELFLMEKFTREVMESDLFTIAMIKVDGVSLDPPDVADRLAGEIINEKVKAMYLTGDYGHKDLLKRVESIVVGDMYPSEGSEIADVVFAVSSIAEVEGTFLNSEGTVRNVAGPSTAPGMTVPEWRIICDIAKKMGASGFEFESLADVTKAIENQGATGKAPIAPDPSPLDDVSAIPAFYRGHKLEDIVCALKDLHKKNSTEDETQDAPGEDDGRLFRILYKKEVVPNTHEIVIHAPEVAEKCQAGQFVIAMADETSERIPYSISDFDREKGTITLIAYEVGRSSRELATMHEGQYLAHFTGPLGTPIEVKKFGTVVCAGGCYGVGAMLPVARAMKEAGNRVICIEEASSHYLLHWQNRLSEVCDELIIVTKDGSVGMKGGVQEAISSIVGRGDKIDQSYIIGCTFMMMLVSDLNRDLGIPTQTAMNPLMLDGTGMCGACRVAEGDVVKFACVDGPFLDGLQIDWKRLLQRKMTFKKEEVDALPQGSRTNAGHFCRCEDK